jgi:hypothetical protein
MNWLDYIKQFFKSPQRWVRTYIPKYEWHDKDYLIEEFLFGCVIHFVEGEECFERVAYDDCDDHKKFAKELTDCYDFVKVRRPKLQKQIDDALTAATNKAGPLEWEDEPCKIDDQLSLKKLKPSKFSYEECYSHHDKLEEKLNKQEEFYMSWIIRNRKQMWT